MTIASWTTRRQFGAGFGALLATFSLEPIRGSAQGAAGMRPAKNRRLDGWIRIGAENTVTVFTGKAELGQGILTALSQIAAEELDVAIDSIRMISADTKRGPDEGYTFGSQSIEQGGSAIRSASAQARAVLVAAAASKLNVQIDELAVQSGVVRAGDGREITYWELTGGDRQLLQIDVTRDVRPKNARQYKVVGKSVPRIDLPKKSWPCRPTYRTCGCPAWYLDERFAPLGRVPDCLRLMRPLLESSPEL